MEKDRFELSELGLNIRHWENLRWVSMTVFIAVTSGLAAAILGIGGAKIPPEVLPWAKVFGALSTFVFWVQDERIVQYWLQFRERAVILEADIGIQVFSCSPKRGLFSAGYAVRLLYIVIFISWIVVNVRSWMC